MTRRTEVKNPTIRLPYPIIGAVLFALLFLGLVAALVSRDQTVRVSRAQGIELAGQRISDLQKGLYTVICIRTGFALSEGDSVRVPRQWVRP